MSAKNSGLGVSWLFAIPPAFQIFSQFVGSLLLPGILTIIAREWRLISERFWGFVFRGYDIEVANLLAPAATLSLLLFMSSGFYRSRREAKTGIKENIFGLSHNIKLLEILYGSFYFLIIYLIMLYSVVFQYGKDFQDKFVQLPFFSTVDLAFIELPASALNIILTILPYCWLSIFVFLLAWVFLNQEKYKDRNLLLRISVFSFKILALGLFGNFVAAPLIFTETLFGSRAAQEIFIGDSEAGFLYLMVVGSLLFSTVYSAQTDYRILRNIIILFGLLIVCDQILIYLAALISEA